MGKLIEMVNRLQAEINTCIKNKFSYDWNNGGTGEHHHHRNLN